MLQWHDRRFLSLCSSDVGLVGICTIRARFQAVHKVQELELHLGRSQTGAHTIQEWLLALRSMHFLQELRLYVTAMPPAATCAVLSSIGKMPQLSLLSVAHCSLKQKDSDTVAGGHVNCTAALLKAMSAGTKLSTLDIPSTSMTQQGMAELAALLPRVTSLQQLNLSGNSLEECAHAVAAACAGLHHMTSLRLGTCSLSAEGMSTMVPALSACTGLQELDLQLNGIGSGDGAAALASVLEHTTALKILNLCSTKLCESGVCCLTPSLRKLQHLTRLDLSYNAIANDAAAALAVALQTLPICVLLLSDNQIGNEGVAHLARSFASMPRLRVAELGDNFFRGAGIDSLKKGLAHCHLHVHNGVRRECCVRYVK
jgi:Ran GTPase-activating protein (RanGAP) involved in mRNA processing and transport